MVTFMRMRRFRPQAVQNITIARFGRMLRPYAESLRKQRKSIGIWYLVDKPRPRQQVEQAGVLEAQ